MDKEKLESEGKLPRSVAELDRAFMGKGYVLSGGYNETIVRHPETLKEHKIKRGKDHDKYFEKLSALERKLKPVKKCTLSDIEIDK